jgi:hypothetical protein
VYRVESRVSMCWLLHDTDSDSERRPEPTANRVLTAGIRCEFLFWGGVGFILEGEREKTKIKGFTT